MKSRTIKWTYARIFILVVGISPLVRPQARVLFSPSVQTRSLQDTFDIHILAENVQDLHAVQTVITFESELIEVMDVSEGSFLKQHGSTWFSFHPADCGQINDTLQVDQAVLGSGSVSGNDTLYCITFIARNTGTTDLSFEKVDMRNSYNQSMSATAENGFITVVNTGVDFQSGTLPRMLKLFPNRPNPFNTETIIPYKLNRDTYVNLDIMNVKGQKIVTLVSEWLPRGSHCRRWNGCDERGKDVPAGMYVSLLNVSNETVTRKMMLIR